MTAATLLLTFGSLVMTVLAVVLIAAGAAVAYVAGRDEDPLVEPVAYIATGLTILLGVAAVAALT